jgi:hypothetical protein
MKRLFQIFSITFVFALTLSSVGRAEDMKLPPDTTSPELARIKSLAGRWTSTTSMFGKPNEVVYTEYEVTANGSAVLERIFPGTPQEMISVYYDDNGKLAMTHYCIMRNRPTLKLSKSDANTIVMDVKKVEGLSSKKEPHMGDITIRFKDKDHMEQTCSGKGEGKKEPMTMEFTRVK